MLYKEKIELGQSVCNSQIGILLISAWLCVKLIIFSGMGAGIYP